MVLYGRFDIQASADAKHPLLSDALVQLSSFRTGVLRLSARELQEEIDAANREMAQYLNQKNRTK